MSHVSSERATLHQYGKFLLPARKSCAIGLCLLVLFGCEPRGRPNILDTPVPSDQVVDFAQLFRQNCSGCHGQGGKMGPAVPLHDDLFRALMPEKDLQDILMSGRKGTLMPAFAIENGGTLTKTQIQVLVKEIAGQPYFVVKNPDDPAKTEVVARAGGLHPAWGVPPVPELGTPSYSVVANMGNSAENIQKGAALFARSCAECHGDKGLGVEEGGKRMKAINDPVFLGLNSDQVLRRIIITGREDLGMPSYAGGRSDPEFKPLTGQDVSDLVALMASWRQGTTTK